MKSDLEFLASKENHRELQQVIEFSLLLILVFIQSQFSSKIETETKQRNDMRILKSQKIIESIKRDEKKVTNPQPLLEKKRIVPREWGKQPGITSTKKVGEHC